MIVHRGAALDYAAKRHADVDNLSPWQWCIRNVVFPEIGYPSSSHGSFDPGRLPFWEEPLNELAKPGYKEIYILKCSQSCASETVGQNAVRWKCATNPEPILWVGAQQDTTEDFWNERLIPGLKVCGRNLANAIRGGHEIGLSFRAPNGASLRATWSKSRGGLKSKSYWLVVADEMDTYEANILEKLRPRLTNYPDGKLLVMSAMDAKKNIPSSESPILSEYKQTDCRERMFVDPGDPSKLFSFSMGLRSEKGETVHGVKWDPGARRKDGTWDLKRVAETAHFVTPSGTIITEEDRLKLLDGGQWVPTKEGRPNAIGFRVPCFLLRQKSFGTTAMNFLRAKHAGEEQLRTFIMEELAEEWHHRRIELGDSDVDARRGDYSGLLSKSQAFSGFYIGHVPTVLLSADVQQKTIYVLLREWIKQDSGLIDWQEVEWNYAAVDALARKHNAWRSFVDARYESTTVLEWASKYPGVIPMYGSDTRMKTLFAQKDLNPLEGRPGASKAKKVGTITWDTWAIKYHLFNLIMQTKGVPKWFVPQSATREYVQQLTSERFRNGKIEEVRKGAPNHLLDCEAEQVAGAILCNLLQPFGSQFVKLEADPS